MNRREVTSSAPVYRKEFFDGTSNMKHGRHYWLAGAQIIQSQGHDILNVDVRNDRKLMVRYFADAQTGTYKAEIQGNYEWKKLCLDNAVNVAAGKRPNAKCGWWGYGYDVQPWEWATQEDRQMAYHYFGEYLQDWETSIGSNKYWSAKHRRLMRIKRMMDDVMPEIPEDYYRWIDREIFGQNYIFATKKPKTAECVCAHCGQRYLVKKIPKRTWTQCRKCGATGLVTYHENTARWETTYLLQKLNNNLGWTERKLELYCTWSPEGKHIDIYEQIRILIRDGERWGTCYYAAGRDNDGDYYQDTNPGNYRHKKGYLYPGTLKEVRECWDDQLKHRGLEILAYRKIPFNVNNAVLSKVDWLEYGIKGGFYRLVQEELNAESLGKIINRAGMTTQEVFKISADRVNRIRSMNGGKTVLSWLQYEQFLGTKISQENLIALDKSGISTDDAWKALEYIRSPEVFANYFRRQARVMKCTMRTALSEYYDYLDMAKKQNLNLNHEIFYKPKDLKAAHDECVRNGQKKELQKRAAEILEKFPDVEKNMDAVREKYSFMDGEYAIVVPEDIVDIIHEGRALGHCIDTSDRYFDRINQKISYLVFLRHADQMNVPWYTLEIEPGGTIRQQRTTGNNQNRKDVDAYMPFIRKWQQVVMDRITEEDKQAAEKSRAVRIREYRELRDKKEKVWHGTLAGKLLADVLEADLIEA